MAVTPINLARVSFNIRSFNLLESVRSNTTNLFQVQNSLATGLRFMQPSGDPVRAAAVTDLDRRLDRLDDVSRNLGNVEAVVTETDSAMQQAMEMLNEANRLAVQSVGDTISEEERHALTAVVESLLSRMVSLGNKKYLNTYLFNGQQDGAPFEEVPWGVKYTGDDNRRESIVDADLSQDWFTVPGQEFFGAVSGEVQGHVDLDPALTAQTRISDLGGALGRGVTLGRVMVGTSTDQVEIDLSGCDTAGDVVDKLNAEMPAGVAAALGTRGITIIRTIPAAGVITVNDVAGGSTATDLGIAMSFNAASRNGQDIDPRLTAVTRIGDLMGGAGLALGDITIRNGEQVATISLAGAQTLQDVLNRITKADVGVVARLADDGKTIEVLNRISGSDMTIEEAGGLTATALGIRSLYGGTRLDALNDGYGVETQTGADFRITTRDGTAIDVDISNAKTLQDVINAINAAAGGAVTASQRVNGNGLVITDQTAGGGTLEIAGLNASIAYRDLGLDVPATGNQLIGQDVNPVRVDSPFTALLELREGMNEDDRLLMQRAGERLERVLRSMQEVQGKLASQAGMVAERVERVEAEQVATRTLKSDVQDVDFTDSVVRFQQLQMALQANLSTASQVMNLSVLDYLR